MKGVSKVVAGITALDDQTISVKLIALFAPFLSLLTMPACYILPSGKQNRHS